ncbi:hypothetical protein GCM10010420_00860 [Streptomyces glaucosporus]|uniref:TM2 domain-containing protein n=1 Tax=Streptomyces glaucosporus TaxID=284044 RepID=A0ABN3HM52_9ACTN
MSDPYQQNPYGQPQQPQHNPYAQPSGQPGQPGQPAYGYPQQVPPPVAPGVYTGDPNAPYGYDPYGRPYSDKSKTTAGLLSLFLGSFGIGRFYTGHTGLALGQLFTCGGCGIWALIDAIILFTQDGATDAQGRVLRS